MRLNRYLDWRRCVDCWGGCYGAGVVVVWWRYGGPCRDILVIVCRRHGRTAGDTTVRHVGELSTLSGAQQLPTQSWYYHTIVVVVVVVVVAVAAAAELWYSVLYFSKRCKEIFLNLQRKQLSDWWAISNVVQPPQRQPPFYGHYTDQSVFAGSSS